MEPSTSDAEIASAKERESERILQQTPDKKEAARRLNMGLSSLYRRIEQLGIQPPEAERAK